MGFPRCGGISHILSHPREAAFLEQFESSSYMDPTLPDEVVAEIDLIMGTFSKSFASIGGGPGYTGIVTSGDYTATDVDALRAALSAP